MLSYFKSMIFLAGLFQSVATLPNWWQETYTNALNDISAHFNSYNSKDYAQLGAVAVGSAFALYLWKKNQSLSNQVTYTNQVANKTAQELMDHKKKYADQEFLTEIQSKVATLLHLYENECALTENASQENLINQLTDFYRAIFADSSKKNKYTNTVIAHKSDVKGYMDVITEKRALWINDSEKALLTYMADKILADNSRLLSCLTMIECHLLTGNVTQQLDALSEQYKQELQILNSSQDLSERIRVVGEYLAENVTKKESLEADLAELNAYAQSLCKTLEELAYCRQGIDYFIECGTHDKQLSAFKEYAKKLDEKTIHFVSHLQLIQAQLPFVKMLALQKYKKLLTHYEIKLGALMHDPVAFERALKEVINQRTSQDSLYPYCDYLSWLQQWQQYFKQLSTTIKEFKPFDDYQQTIVQETQELFDIFDALVEYVSRCEPQRTEKRERKKADDLAATLSLHRKELRQVSSKIAAVESRCTRIDSRVDSIKSSCSSLHSDVSRLRSRVTSLERRPIYHPHR